MRSSDQVMFSCDWRPATKVSSGASKAEHWGMTRAKTLYAPIKDRIRLTVVGLLHVERAESR